MITEMDIVKTVANKLKETFSFSVHTNSVKEGFTKECFFIEVISPTVELIGTEMKENEMSIRVTFFARTDMKEKELWKIKQRLSEMFLLGLQVTEDFFISWEEPLNFNFTTSGNLEMLLQIHFVEDLPEEDGEMIEELDTSFGKE